MRPFSSTISAAVRESLGEHAALIAVVGAYVLATFVVATVYGLPYSVFPNLVRYGLLLSFPLYFAFCWHAVKVLAFVRPARPTLYLLSSLKPYLKPQRLLFAAPAVLLIPVFATTFTFFKFGIPVLNPYSWDPFFTRLDYMMHGGHHPWTLLQPILGYPSVTRAIDVLYETWLFAMYALVTLQAFDTRRRELRMRFLLSFLVSWIVLGTIGAIAFSSMGPCYDPGVRNDTGPYAPLMAYLAEVDKLHPIGALRTQQMLWDNYRNNTMAIGSGISAMPSLHVAIAVLMALFGRRYSRTAGIVLTAYAVVIFLGSIHLGWHYAVDGYVGAFGAWLIWWLVGRSQEHGRRWSFATPSTKVEAPLEPTAAAEARTLRRQGLGAPKKL